MASNDPTYRKRIRILARFWVITPAALAVLELIFFATTGKDRHETWMWIFVSQTLFNMLIWRKDL